jgi:hypothetical protein
MSFHAPVAHPGWMNRNVRRSRHAALQIVLCSGRDFYEIIPRHCPRRRAIQGRESKVKQGELELPRSLEKVALDHPAKPGDGAFLYWF